MINIPKGTKDMLPQEAYKWHYVENIARETAAEFGFKEIRTPMFEHTELFLRGVGETTDIVTKEMYTFDDKGGRSMTLRPEGTAGVARCFIENGLLYFNGRLDRQVKIMGYRIEPEDIENNLLKLPGVTQALVSVSGKNRITAHVTANATTPEELRRGLSELVPEYMLPGRIVIVEQLPVSGSFKLRRNIGE